MYTFLALAIILDAVQVYDIELSASLLKLKIRNTTEYLKWRIAILKRDKFKCRMCSASIKDNKTLRLEVHHTKSFNDICKESTITTIKQALECKEVYFSPTVFVNTYGFIS